jgi:hypothetical protein
VKSRGPYIRGHPLRHVLLDNKLGSTPKMGHWAVSSWPDLWQMPTQHDHPQPVVFKIPETVGLSLDELHLAVEAFSYAVAVGEDKHPQHFFAP